MRIEIRQEQVTDYKDVFLINYKAFERNSEANLVDVLRNSDAFIPELSLVALADGEICGHILFPRIDIASNTGEIFHSLALAPMAVKPPFQNRGIGTKLVDVGLKKACELGYTSVIVLGHPDYYPRFGFGPAGRWGIKSPYDVPDNAFLALELMPGSLKGVQGTVNYPPEFESI